MWTFWVPWRFWAYAFLRNPRSSTLSKDSDTAQRFGSIRSIRRLWHGSCKVRDTRAVARVSRTLHEPCRSLRTLRMDPKRCALSGFLLKVMRRAAVAAEWRNALSVRLPQCGVSGSRLFPKPAPLLFEQRLRHSAVRSIRFFAQSDAVSSCSGGVDLRKFSRATRHTVKLLPSAALLPTLSSPCALPLGPGGAAAHAGVAFSAFRALVAPTWRCARSARTRLSVRLACVARSRPLRPLPPCALLAGSGAVVAHGSRALAPGPCARLCAPSLGPGA